MMTSDCSREQSSNPDFLPLYLIQTAWRMLFHTVLLQLQPYCTITGNETDVMKINFSDNIVMLY